MTVLNILKKCLVASKIEILCNIILTKNILNFYMVLWNFILTSKRKYKKKYFLNIIIVSTPFLESQLTIILLLTLLRIKCQQTANTQGFNRFTNDKIKSLDQLIEHYQ